MGPSEGLRPSRGVVAEQRRTDTSQDQESSHETSKVHRGVTGAVHEIIWIGASLADPVGEGCDNVDGDHQERPVLVP